MGCLPEQRLLRHLRRIFGSMRAETSGEYLARCGRRGSGRTKSNPLQCCARMATLEHGVMAMSGAVVFANSALVDMYLKCSSAEDARLAFAAAHERSVTMWTAVTSGHVREALALFGQMTRDGFRPNDVTFLAVLSACTHGGLVDEGLRHFSSMPSNYGLTPKAEHYAAVVGRLRDAYELVKNLPDCQEHSVVWGELLGACRKHGGDVRLVELVARRFFLLQPGNAGKYVVLANTYAACDMWDSVAGMYEAMKSLGIRKDPAWSAVEVQGKKHIFLARDTYHDKCSAIYEACNLLASAITEQSEM